MGVTVQVRDLDPAVNDRLKGEAAAKGLSYSEYLRRELTRIAEKLRIDERWREVSAESRASTERPSAPVEPWRPLGMRTDEIVASIRQDRDGR
ncbi:MAG: hypothetical protein AAGC66_17845 [Leifsonia sp.]